MTGLPITDELDANTLSGLFMQRLARMPEPRDEITESGFLLRVLGMDENRVGKVLIENQAVEENGRTMPATAENEPPPGTSGDRPAAKPASGDRD